MAKRQDSSRSKERQKSLISPAAQRTLIFLGLAVTGVIFAIGLILPGRGLIADTLRDVIAPWFGGGRWLLPPLLIATGVWVERRAAASSRPLLRVLLGALGFAALLALIEILLPGRGGIIGGLLGSGSAQMLTGIGAAVAWFAILVGVGLVLNDALVRSIFRALFSGAKGGVGVALRGAESLVEARQRAEASREAASPVEPPLSPLPPRPIRIEEAAPVPSSATLAPPKVSGAGVRAGASARSASTIAADLPAAGTPTEWRLPSYSLLPERKAVAAGGGMDHSTNMEVIRRKLESFGITATVDAYSSGPVVTQYEVLPSADVRLSRIEALADDLAMALSARSIRIQAPIPGRSVVGIEIPNREGVVVDLRSVFEKREMAGPTAKLMFALGKDVGGSEEAADLGKMPHLLIAGATGSGKSVMVNALIASLLFHNTPDELHLILVDPKHVELSGYNGLPHLLVPVITEAQKASTVLMWAVTEMERRYHLFAAAGARNLEAYNEMIAEVQALDPGDPERVSHSLASADRLEFIVIVIDELADLMMQDGRNTEEPIVRIAQKARATGIHMVLATQRPSVNVVTGLIKANIPSRIAFSMASQIDSRTVLDAPGAEDLIGRGDMLFQPSDMPKPVRLQGVFVSDAEIAAVVNHWKSQGAPRYRLDILDDGSQGRSSSAASGRPDEDRDRLFDEAASVINEHDRASASLLQRRLRIGYARAARIIDQLEAAGYIGAFDGSNARVVLSREGGHASTPEEGAGEDQ
ncbi:MAG: hypothetical protein RIQ87_563 [Chloroflexota bacterium]|jgi:S-DNA-T family DNA segregation ATPase FtsK/SpoIIIE